VDHAGILFLNGAGFRVRFNQAKAGMGNNQRSKKVIYLVTIGFNAEWKIPKVNSLLPHPVPPGLPNPAHPDR